MKSLKTYLVETEQVDDLMSFFKEKKISDLNTFKEIRKTHTFNTPNQVLLFDRDGEPKGNQIVARNYNEWSGPYTFAVFINDPSLSYNTFEITNGKLFSMGREFMTEDGYIGRRYHDKDYLPLKVSINTKYDSEKTIWFFDRTEITRFGEFIQKILYHEMKHVLNDHEKAFEAVKKAVTVNVEGGFVSRSLAARVLKVVLKTRFLNRILSTDMNREKIKPIIQKVEDLINEIS
jgi:hypothetical protein